MKNKKIGLILLIIFSFVQANSQVSYFRSDTNLIKISGSTITSQPSPTSGDSVYAQTSNFFSFQGYDTIAFDHKITNSSGTLQRMVVQLVDASGNIFMNMYTIIYSGSSLYPTRVPLFVSSSGNYKVRFSFFRNGGNSGQKFEISNVSIFTPLVPLPIQDQKKKEVTSKVKEIPSGIYPSPFRDYLNVVKENITGIRIKTLEGKLIFSDSYEALGSVGIPTEDFSRGIYLIEIEIDGGEREVKRIIKSE